ncbi:VWA domain-containing protein [Reinekea marinisedimentorum]|uniref:Ca-activated chloride channel family protein n=1 Tax=Reinekea marinisedimentorum TaxID=230495 RepID=A0A4R3I8T6_9GAMM|nr:VWA domain-containing protein [Reinekea marinisedimentorum]TCS40648.1 Ca-activated chloride channel family protein [Reinekea marinisedimentorum]
MSFAWPWFLAALPLLWLIPRSRSSASQGALNHPYLATLANQQQTTPGKRKLPLLWLLSWLFLVLALMRPQWIGEPITNTQAGRSIFLSVDLSESMLTEDMRWNGQSTYRYKAVQEVVGEFVEQRKGDFLGLVVFGSFAAVQAPLTPDTGAVQALLFDLIPGMAGKSTAIGDGLAQSVKQLRTSKSKDKIIILLSDGENNAGSVSPSDAITAAQKSDIRVYTIGFGGDASASSSFFNFMRSSGIDEATLKSIADQTGGQYFRATSAGELKQVFELIDQLETDDKDIDNFRQINELYWLPLTASLLLLGFAQVNRSTLRGRNA